MHHRDAEGREHRAEAPDAGDTLCAEYRQKLAAEAEAGAHAAAGDEPLSSPAGEPVPDLVCAAYARYAAPVDGAAGEVFAHAVAVLNASSRARAELPDLPMTVLYDEVWSLRADLRQRFAIDQADGRTAFLRWLVESGAAELAIPAAFLAPARAALDRARVHALEAEQFDSASAAAAPDGEPALAARQARDIRLLVTSNRGLRRDVLALQVRSWRDEEQIATLETELAAARDAYGAAIRRGHELATRLEQRQSWQAGAFGVRPRSDAEPAELCVLPSGDGPFFTRGFRLGEGIAIVGAAARRATGAPSGAMVFGPYIRLSPGSYGVALDARLYRPLPPLADFTVEAVCDRARLTLRSRRFRLLSPLGGRRFAFDFTVADGEDHPDFEIRVWARRGTPLEIGRIILYRLPEPDGTAPRG